MVFQRAHEFQIKLAESWSEDEALTFITWYFLDSDGQKLEVTLSTMPHRVDVQTRIGQFTLAFIDPETLMIQFPSQACGIQMTTVGNTVLQDQRGAIIHHEDKMPLTISYTSDTLVNQDIEPNGGLGTQHHLQFQPSNNEDMFILHITRTTRRNRYIPNPITIIEDANKRWGAWLNNAPEVPEHYREQYYFAWWIMGVNLVRSYFYPYHEGMIPSKVGYVGIWNWDSYFHVLALRHQDLELAQNQFRILFDHQLPNGMLPDVVQDDGALSHTTDYGIDAHITKPPLTAWAIWKVYEVSHDKAFLHEMYDQLVLSHRWWREEQNADGFFNYAHPYSSGLDNSPLFDDGLLETPDLTTYLILQAGTLAKIASEIDRGDDSQQWQQEAEDLTQRLIQLRWDEEAGLFWAWRDGQPVKIKTPLSLLPLITGRLPQAIVKRLIEHLTDSDEFWTTFPIPTVAKNDPTHDPMTMWRGPVWVNMNYLMIDGLQRAGYPELARQLRHKTISMMMRNKDIYEYYHPITGDKPPKAVSIFGWSTALFIDLILQHSVNSQ